MHRRHYLLFLWWINISGAVNTKGGTGFDSILFCGGKNTQNSDGQVRICFSDILWSIGAGERISVLLIFWHLSGWILVNLLLFLAWGLNEAQHRCKHKEVNGVDVLCMMGQRCYCTATGRIAQRQLTCSNPHSVSLCFQWWPLWCKCACVGGQKSLEGFVASLERVQLLKEYLIGLFSPIFMCFVLSIQVLGIDNHFFVLKQEQKTCCWLWFADNRILVTHLPAGFC